MLDGGEATGEKQKVLTMGMGKLWSLVSGEEARENTLWWEKWEKQNFFQSMSWSTFVL